MEPHREALLALSRDVRIHAHPELSGAEHHACAAVADFMAARGFTVERRAGGLETALIAVDDSCAKDDGAVTVAFLSEYDALPGLGHACGHNLIAVLGVGAALAFRDAAKAQGLNARVILFGSPAEETFGGKINLVDHGAFDKVDVALMAHPGTQNALRGVWLAMVSFSIEFFGKPSHASALPWEGVNALDAAVLAYQSVSVLRQQTLPSNRIHGIIKHGGDAPNIIPEYTKMEYYIRSERIEDLLELKAKIFKCFEGAALATGCTVKITEDPTFANVNHNDTLCAIYESHMRRLGADFTPDDVARTESRGSTGAQAAHGARCAAPRILPHKRNSRLLAGIADALHTLPASPLTSGALTRWSRLVLSCAPCLSVPMPSPDLDSPLATRPVATHTDMGNVTHVVPGIHPVFDIGARGFSYHTAEFAALAGQTSAFDRTMLAAYALAMTGIECATSPETLAKVRRDFQGA
ncbi:hypothetical protein HK105_205147 [Polyrhizophydium stewartii]|uniref:Peptidase M20 dimerisation domain-containing protein n=1 Tax=Polyrhizophydium stewartii TaxID=2732419 RepID=A0ABR4N6W3_9FUNG